jgi:hypothetical protein
MLDCEGQPCGHHVVFFYAWRFGGHHISMLDCKGWPNDHQVVFFVCLENWWPQGYSTLDCKGQPSDHQVVFSYCLESWWPIGFFLFFFSLGDMVATNMFQCWTMRDDLVATNSFFLIAWRLGGQQVVWH